MGPTPFASSGKKVCRPIGRSANRRFSGTQPRLSPLTVTSYKFETMMSRDTRAPEYKEADRQTAQQPVVSTPRARQGVTGHNVRYVLGFGLAAVVAAFIVVYLIYVG